MASLSLTPKSPSKYSNQTFSPTAKRYVFTPKLNLKAPRAWERKPSTPFAPRNETQKIWKRYEFPDSHINGASIDEIRQDKTTETHALKKIRVGGREASAHITSWDVEPHQTTHKRPAHQDGSTIIPAPVSDATTTDGKVKSLARNIERVIIPSDTSLDAGDENAADAIRVGRQATSIMADTAPTQEELDKGGPEEASKQGPLPEKHAMAESLHSEREHDLTDQNLNRQLTEPENPLPAHVDTRSPGIRVESSAPHTETGEEEALAVASSVKKSIAGEGQTGLEQPIYRAAAIRTTSPCEEALNDEGNPKRRRATNFDHQPRSLQTEITIGAYGALGRNASEVLLPSIGDTGHADDHEVFKAQGTESDVSSPTKMAMHVQRGGPLAVGGLESIPHKQTKAAITSDAIEAEKKEGTQLNSPTRRILPRQAQSEACKPFAFVQDDDRDYLHAFLTRAKAKKAARDASPEKSDQVLRSPMTRSRTALVPLSTNSPSPKKTNRYEAHLESTQGSDILDTIEQGSPCRRSGRARLPRPQKAPTVTPSTIPVRRAKGNEFVFLQSTDTAQLALATRKNTKRNKGEAVMPKVKLEALSHLQKSPSKSPKPRKGKEVSWKEEPTYFGVQADDAEDGEKRKTEERPRTRKVRRLGGGNGTPAPKKMMLEDAMDVRTPVSRKRGKVK